MCCVRQGTIPQAISPVAVEERWCVWMATETLRPTVQTVSQQKDAVSHTCAMPAHDHSTTPGHVHTGSLAVVTVYIHSLVKYMCAYVYKHWYSDSQLGGRC